MLQVDDTKEGRRHVWECGQTCRICGKSFKTKSLLRKHGVVHTEKHKCAVCGKSFSGSQNKNDLMRCFEQFLQTDESCKKFNGLELVYCDSEKIGGGGGESPHKPRGEREL